MGLKLVRCTTCGHQMNIDLDKMQHTCEACGNTFVSNIAAELNENNNFDADKLKNLRENLSRSVSSNDLNAILRFSQEILVMIPKDFSAQYYNSYASAKLVNPIQLHQFLKSSKFEVTSSELEKVIIHLSKNIDLRDRKLVHDFITNNKLELLNIFERIFSERVRLEDNYAIVQRDVFICHRSTDSIIVNKVVKEIENDGNICWVSNRNLRPNDNENYWKNITEAIEHCSIFLVISSQDAMLSKDVQREMQIATKYKLKKLEYKIDDSMHTTQFKHFFDGVKWIDAIQSDSFEELKSRIFNLIHENTQTREPAPIQNTTINNNITSIVKRMYFELNLGKFEAANEIIDKIFDIDIENKDAWMAKLLINNTNKNLDEFLDSLQYKSLSDLEGIENSEDFIALERIDASNIIVKQLKAQISSKVILEKELAFKKKDKEFLSRLSSKYPNPALDRLYLTLIENNINAVDKFDNLLQDIQSYEILKNIFGNQKFGLYLSDPLIEPYFQKFQELVKQYNANEERKIAEYNADKNAFITKTKDLILTGDYSEVVEFINANKEKYNVFPQFYEYMFLAVYRLNSIEDIQQREFTLNEKRAFVNDKVVNEFIQFCDSNIINEIVNSFKKEINEIDAEQKRINQEVTRKRNKKTIRLSLATVAVVALVIFTILLYLNLPVNINYNLNGGSGEGLVESIKNKDLPYTLPELTKVGYTFSGWYTNDEASGDEITEITPGIFKTEAVYAKWEINQYKISFEANGGSAVDDIEQDYASIVTEPRIEREGYTFGGWYLDVVFEEEYIFNTMPAENLMVV